MENKKLIYTIGHSNHDLSTFLALLKSHNIDSVVDVRSVPFSKYTPHFNQDQLIKSLKEENIHYIPMGDQLGARWDELYLYNDNNRLDFSKVRQTEKFKTGINRLLSGLKEGYNISLMCTEKNPSDCHRTILIAYSLSKMEIKINHILADGKIKEHQQLEKELIESHFGEIDQLDLFSENNGIKDRLEKLETAYQKKEEEIAYQIQQEAINIG
ncbi:DUF488 domain-containing protein [Fuchsiella alkaliacetigena]|uniref:DUF488 domain-containing protein n=1 Tax=Fuchsiella alkaliacetigena TaxID=957042 RepID=UPI00200A9E5C|nr:DUF488 domain-containing protein [Fuchsiella alkaliacetigena]MCK8824340.1 DUF488 domain-containing protein [Fuchsiella alkaliacetigena]